MRPNIRSASGAILMLAIIPIFAGLLACMPVPIGDPEKSRIDPDLSGIWTVRTEDETGPLYFLRPWDKRTWLILGVVPGEETEDGVRQMTFETTEELLKALANGDLEAKEVSAHKAWLKKLGGEMFMTWESVGGYDEDGLVLSEYWLVWKLEKSGVDAFRLRMVNGEHDVFDDLEKPDGSLEDANRLRRQWERALKKAVDDPELYAEDEGVWHFERVPAELLDDAMYLFEEVIEFD